MTRKSKYLAWYCVYHQEHNIAAKLYEIHTFCTVNLLLILQVVNTPTLNTIFLTSTIPRDNKIRDENETNQ